MDRKYKINEWFRIINDFRRIEASFMRDMVKYIVWMMF